MCAAFTKGNVKTTGPDPCAASIFIGYHQLLCGGKTFLNVLKRFSLPPAHFNAGSCVSNHKFTCSSSKAQVFQWGKQRKNMKGLGQCAVFPKTSTILDIYQGFLKISFCSETKGRNKPGHVAEWFLSFLLETPNMIGITSIVLLCIRWQYIISASHKNNFVCSYFGFISCLFIDFTFTLIQVWPQI